MMKITGSCSITNNTEKSTHYDGGQSISADDKSDRILKIGDLTPKPSPAAMTTAALVERSHPNRVLSSPEKMHLCLQGSATDCIPRERLAGGWCHDCSRGATTRGTTPPSLPSLLATQTGPRPVRWAMHWAGSGSCHPWGSLACRLQPTHSHVGAVVFVLMCMCVWAGGSVSPWKPVSSSVGRRPPNRRAAAMATPAC